MDSVSTPSGPIRNIGAWTFEQLQAWADRPDHHGQELERIREVTVRHAQDDHLDPADRNRWAKLSLQVNARMHGDSPWQQARMAANNFRLRTLIIDRLGPDIQDPVWNPDLVAAGILAALNLTPTQARELSDHWQALPVERIGELATSRTQQPRSSGSSATSSPVQSATRPENGSPSANSCPEQRTRPTATRPAGIVPDSHLRTHQRVPRHPSSTPLTTRTPRSQSYRS